MARDLYLLKYSWIEHHPAIVNESINIYRYIDIYHIYILYNFCGYTGRVYMRFGPLGL